MNKSVPKHIWQGENEVAEFIEKLKPRPVGVVISDRLCL